jgi:hypothetical protein
MVVMMETASIQTSNYATVVAVETASIQTTIYATVVAVETVNVSIRSQKPAPVVAEET